MKKSSHIQYFPSDVLGKIFAYIDDEDMCNTVPFVCEKWKIVSSHSLMMKNANFDGKSVTSKDICFVLHNAPHLESVNISTCDNLVPVLRQICRSNKQIKKLILKECSSNGNIIPEHVLINVLYSLPALQTLELYHTRFNSRLFFEVIARTSNITGIDLSLNEFITLNDLMTLVHNSKLNEFKLSRRLREPHITDEEMSHLVRTMCQQLTLLHLDMSGIGSSTYYEILSCSKLTDLKLNNAINLSTELLEKIPFQLRKLQHLNIEGPTHGMARGALFSCLFYNTNLGQQLETLKLKNFDPLVDEECCDIIESCPNLTALSLKGCKCLRFGGVREALLRLKKLQYLNIAFLDKIGDFECIKELPELKVLISDDVLCKQTALLHPNKELRVIILERNKLRA